MVVAKEEESPQAVPGRVKPPDDWKDLLPEVTGSDGERILRLGKDILILSQKCAQRDAGQERLIRKHEQLVDALLEQARGGAATVAHIPDIPDIPDISDKWARLQLQCLSQLGRLIEVQMRWGAKGGGKGKADPADKHRERVIREARDRREKALRVVSGGGGDDE